MELSYGKIHYAELTMLLLLLKSIAGLFMYRMLVLIPQCVHYYDRVNAVGYSGVLFGLMTVGSLMNPSGSVTVGFGIDVPSIFVTFFYLIVSTLLFPQSSFIGHLAGIIAGIIEHFALSFWIYKQPYHLPFVIMAGGFSLLILFGIIFQKNEETEDDVQTVGNESVIESLLPLFSCARNTWRDTSQRSESNELTMRNGILVPRHSTSMNTFIGSHSGRTIGEPSSLVDSPTNSARLAAISRSNTRYMPLDEGSE